MSWLNRLFKKKVKRTWIVKTYLMSRSFRGYKYLYEDITWGPDEEKAKIFKEIPLDRDNRWEIVEEVK